MKSKEEWIYEREGSIGYEREGNISTRGFLGWRGIEAQLGERF